MSSKAPVTKTAICWRANGDRGRELQAQVDDGEPSAGRRLIGQQAQVDQILVPPGGLLVPDQGVTTHE